MKLLKHKADSQADPRAGRLRRAAALRLAKSDLHLLPGPSGSQGAIWHWE